MEVAVDDGGLFFTPFGKIVDSFVDAIVISAVGGGFGPEIGVITDVLFGGIVVVVATDDRTGKIAVFDDGFQFTFIALADLVAEDDGPFIGLTDGSVGVQESFSHPVQ